MDRNERESLVYRIVTGETQLSIGQNIYTIKATTAHLRFKAAELYKQTKKQNRFNPWLTDKDCIRLLIQNNLCSADIDNNLKIISKEIDNLKVRLFDTITNAVEHKKIRERLKKVKVKQEEMVTTRHMYDHLTLAGFAEMVKRQFLIFSTTYCGSKKLWDNPKDVDFIVLERLTSAVLQNTVGVDKLREIARTDPWRNYWNLQKDNIFGHTSVVELTDEQKTLLLFSKMYDSAYENPDCPTDDIIGDDDLFDGWMISQRRQNEKGRKTKQINKKLGKLRDSDEVFIVAKNADEVKAIHDMNDMEGQIIKAKRKAVLKQKGKAVDANFSDRKLQMQQQSNNQFITTVKQGKK